MFAGRGLLLLLVAAGAAGDGWRPRSKPTRAYRPNKDAAALLKLVMEREKHWALVLQEPVKMLGRPPYEDRSFIETPSLLPPVPAAGKSDQIVYNVHKIVSMVSSHYSPVRSFVEYGAKVVRRALACFTYRMLLFQFKCVRLMMMKKAGAPEVSTVAYNLRDNMAAYIDLLATVPDDDLSAMLDIYWHAVKTAQNKNMQRLDRQPWANKLKKTMKNTVKEITRFLTEKCHDYKTNEDYYLNTGVKKLPPLFRDPSLDTMLGIEEMVVMTRDQGNFIAQYARNLGINTLPKSLWTSMFFSRGQPRSDEDVPEEKTDQETSEEAGPSTSKADESSGDPEAVPLQ